MKYMPNYKNSEFPERDFFFEVLSTMYPNETYEMIKHAYAERQTHYEEGDNEMIKITQKIYEHIKDVVAYKRSLYCYYGLDTPGRVMPLLKIKSMNKKESKPRTAFTVDLSKFEKLSESNKKSQLASKAFGTGDRLVRNEMELDDDKEEKKSNDN